MEIRKAVLKRFAVEMPKLVKVFNAFLGEISLPAYRLARVNKVIWNISKIDNFCSKIQEKVQKYNF